MVIFVPGDSAPGRPPTIRIGRGERGARYKTAHNNSPIPYNCPLRTRIAHPIAHCGVRSRILNSELGDVVVTFTRVNGNSSRERSTQDRPNSLRVRQWYSRPAPPHTARYLRKASSRRPRGTAVAARVVCAVSRRANHRSSPTARSTIGRPQPNCTAHLIHPRTNTDHMFRQVCWRDNATKFARTHLQAHTRAQTVRAAMQALSSCLWEVATARLHAIDAPRLAVLPAIKWQIRCWRSCWADYALSATKVLEEHGVKGRAGPRKTLENFEALECASVIRAGKRRYRVSADGC